MNNEKKLYRSNRNRMICGVCAGLAEYFHIDPTVVRLIWALATLIGIAPGVIAYLVAAVIIPQSPYDF